MGWMGRVQTHILRIVDLVRQVKQHPSVGAGNARPPDCFLSKHTGGSATTIHVRIQGYHSMVCPQGALDKVSLGLLGLLPEEAYLTDGFSPAPEDTDAGFQL